MRPPLGLRAEDPTIAELLKPHGYATGQFGKNHLGDRNEFLPTVHGFDEFFGNLYHLNAEEDPESPNYPFPRGLPALPGAVRAARRPALLGERRGRRHRGAPLGARRQAADRGLGAVDAQAHGDDRRRGAGARARLHRPPARSGDPVLRVVQHDPHAPADPHQAREPRPGGALAVAVPRHDDRPRQDGRRPAGQARRAGDHGPHDRRLLDRHRAPT
jgi:arylsulfatase A-like enzyme